MHLLALETSTERLSVAVSRDGALHVREVDAGQRHSELAIDVIREVLAEAALDAQSLSAVAFGQGPGSFVGVRIACGLAQGIARGANVGTVPVPTLLALAEQARRVTPAVDRVLVAVDARMQEIYFAAYEWCGSEWNTVIEPMLVDENTLPTLTGDDWVGIGSAFDQTELGATLNRHYGFMLRDVVRAALPSATDVAAIAARYMARGEALVPPSAAAPLYLRNNVAQTIAERAATRNALASV
jgi:tRNA threonylcarbamoyladenosine biosynthesis protein TsaB